MTKNTFNLSWHQGDRLICDYEISEKDLEIIHDALRLRWQHTDGIRKDLSDRYLPKGVSEALRDVMDETNQTLYDLEEFIGETKGASPWDSFDEQEMLR